MKISEVYPEYVFQRLAKYRVIAIDFNKGEFVELATKTVAQVHRYILTADVKFYQIEDAETA